MQNAINNNITNIIYHILASIKTLFKHSLMMAQVVPKHAAALTDCTIVYVVCTQWVRKKNISYIYANFIASMQLCFQSQCLPVGTTATLQIN